MKQLLFLACVTLIVQTCEPVDGDPVETIKPSKTSLYFSAQGGADTVTTQGTFWRITEVMSINGKPYQFEYKTDTNGYYLPGCFKTEDGEDVCIAKSYLSSGGSIESVGKIEGPWFTIDKATARMLTFAVTPNETGKPRKLLLPITAGNYSQGITVAQAAE
jgi:hypothetical protein